MTGRDDGHIRLDMQGVDQPDELGSHGRGGQGIAQLHQDPLRGEEGARRLPAQGHGLGVQLIPRIDERQKIRRVAKGRLHCLDT